MKKIFVFLAMFIFMVSSALATDLDITPDLVSMSTTDVKVVDACISKSGGDPLVGADLVVETYCMDLNSNEVCDGADISLPAGFSAVVTSTPTDASGCGEITLTTSAATPGQYAYKVNGEDGGVIVASEHGLVLVPEFGIIAALGMLTIAGMFVARNRKRK